MAGPDPEQRVRQPVGLMRWESLTFLHWPYPPDVVQRLLPDGLTVDTWRGRAWVALTPFVMRDVRPPRLPALPGLSTFPETNVRTYARDRTGRDGLWFFSLDTTRVASLAARAIGLPYCWARMSVERNGDEIVYTTSRRRVPPSTEVSSRVGVRDGSAVASRDLTDFDHFLTGRWRAFSAQAGRLVCTPVEHPPWPLRRATVTALESTTVAAAGLPAPVGDPVVHFSPGVDVRLGAPRLVG